MKNSFLLIGLLWLVAACGQPKAKFNDIENQQWQVENQLSFTVTANELNQKKPILHLRHTDNYPFQNLWLKISCQPKDSMPKFERIEIQLAQPDGRWIGKKQGAIYAISTELNSLNCLSDTCNIVIEQNMRANPLEGIQAVGIE